MHTMRYVSGFLYHSPTQQILLQQTDDSALSYTTFSGPINDSESVEDAFKRIIGEELHIKLPREAITQVYDYVVENDEHYFILFAEIQDTQVGEKTGSGKQPAWVQMKQLNKLKVPKQIKQDIIVGQRVINLIERNRLEAESDGENANQ
jgi:NADH pyrophosphatase NudC (nudix superfamily)